MTVFRTLIVDNLTYDRVCVYVAADLNSEVVKLKHDLCFSAAVHAVADT